MDFRSTLLDFKKEIDPQIEEFFDGEIEDIREKDDFSAEIVSYIKKLVLSGGKRIRPALVFNGYKAFGGKEKEKIMKIAIATELIHIFLLIHDDIIDRGEKRHGVDVLNKWVEKKSEAEFKDDDSMRYGNSVAIIAGDMAFALANKLVAKSGFSENLLVEVFAYLQKIVLSTCIGQNQDINIEYSDMAKKTEVMKMYENKTARYTFEGPLRLGAILAGAGRKDFDSISKYAIPIGVAFQIQDDILGIFGDEEKIGKSAASDIIEGKKSILVLSAMENGNEAEKEKINFLLGKKDISENEIAEFRAIIKKSGALESAKDEMKKLIEKGKSSSDEIGTDKEVHVFLSSMGDYMLSREL